MCRGGIGQIEDAEKGEFDPVGCNLCARWAVDPPTRDRSVCDAKIGQSRVISEEDKVLRFVVM